MAASKPLLLLLAEIEENSTGTHTLSPNSATHAHTAPQPALAQTHLLVPPGATHTQVASSPALVQTHRLTPDAAWHGHVATMLDGAVTYGYPVRDARLTLTTQPGRLALTTQPGRMEIS